MDFLTDAIVLSEPLAAELQCSPSRTTSKQRGVHAKLVSIGSHSKDKYTEWAIPFCGCLLVQRLQRGNWELRRIPVLQWACGCQDYAIGNIS